MDGPIMTITLACCMSAGAICGGVTNAIAEWKYDRFMSDPSVFHLVDEAGNAVGQELK